MLKTGNINTARKKRRLQTYIFAIFLCASVLPLIIAGMISYNQSKKSSMEAALSAQDQFAQLALMEMNEVIEHVNRIYMQLAVNSDLAEALHVEPATDLDELQRSNYVTKNILNPYLALYPFIENLIVYPEGGNYAILSGSNGFSLTRDFVTFSIYQDAIHSPIIPRWHGLHTYEGKYFSYQLNDVLSFSQAVVNPSQRAFVLEIQIKKEYFDKMLHSGHDSYDSSIILLDADGRIISSNQYLMQDKVDEIFQTRETAYIVQELTLDNGWRLVCATSQAKLKESTRVHLYTTIGTTFIYILLASCLAQMTSVMISTPVKKVIANMKVPLVDDGVKCRFDSNIWEIDYLSNSFQKMRERTRKLISDLISEQNKKKEAELKVLQSQINPHFLYNSLNLIRCSAVLNQQADIEKITVAVIHLLEFSIQNQECVSVEDEVAMTKKYVTLQECRHNKKMHIDIQVHDGLGKNLVLKLSLVPLVENAIIHAYKDLEDTVKIDVSIYKENDKMVIEVRDYGVGMTQKRIDEVLNKLDKNRKFNRIGLRNIIDRIQLYFGSKYCMSIFCEEGMGTTVRIEHPILTESEWVVSKEIHHE